eukprot:CAMPEP_0175971866 /NCGR_PEP_ID=MMETSP0108-20121206/41897_1 /TAXON_ID=195067 ORGANISM="Goniomonas pacifica, Strain CCMP1869" /NCGR_SAMPLE_ID=MMETSP0108 /ASSEMBLY_ACC=CAM_ASM_000204 /LENGTH=47 /DNA_ID= /DNA_START= /DNA_END= /DNA_ORIENTATION=
MMALRHAHGKHTNPRSSHNTPITTLQRLSVLKSKTWVLLLAATVFGT